MHTAHSITPSSVSSSHSDMSLGSPSTQTSNASSPTQQSQEQRPSPAMLKSSRGGTLDRLINKFPMSLFSRHGRKAGPNTNTDTVSPAKVPEHQLKTEFETARNRYMSLFTTLHALEQTDFPEPIAEFDRKIAKATTAEEKLELIKSANIFLARQIMKMHDLEKQSQKYSGLVNRLISLGQTDILGDYNLKTRGFTHEGKSIEQKVEILRTLNDEITSEIDDIENGDKIAKDMLGF